MIDRLLAEPHRFEFFQAVRQLERWFDREEQAPDGAAGPTRIRFRNSLSLAFPASEIAAFRLVASGDRPSIGPGSVERIEMTPAFIGLLGVGGTLPAFYTELFAEREAHGKDTAARAFLDIFLHRAVVLFYRAWRKARLDLGFEADRRTGFLPYVLALAGIGHPAMRDRLQPREGGVSDRTIAFFAGALQQRPVSAATIRRILEHYFGIGVRLEPFVGRWFMLPVDNQTALGSGSAGPGSARLGQGAVVGERVWQRDLRMRLTLGPMPHATFRRFLPGGTAERALRELLTFFTGVTLEYEIRLALHAEDVHPPRLGADDAPRLGWDSFLVTRTSTTDRDDPGYDLHALA